MLCMKNHVTNLSIFKGDLPDQRHTLVLGPSVGQVEVGEWAEVDHVRNALPQRLVDYIVSTQALRLRYSTIKVKWFKFNWNRRMTLKPSLKYPRHMGFIWMIFGNGSEDGSLTQRQPRMCSHLEGCWQLFHMSGSYRSLFFQSNLWCFSCSSVE